ncbi:MAG: hypothetical protein MJ189_04810, partial [Coriobacteriales bacterium]|nr:hypothetical protein [Coriobacteriales bacterium]
MDFKKLLKKFFISFVCVLMLVAYFPANCFIAKGSDKLKQDTDIYEDQFTEEVQKENNLFTTLLNYFDALPSDDDINALTNEEDLLNVKNQISYIQNYYKNATSPETVANSMNVSIEELNENNFLTEANKNEYQSNILPILDDKLDLINDRLEFIDYEKFSNIIKNAITQEQFKNASQEFKDIINLINSLPLSYDEIDGFKIENCSSDETSSLVSLIAIIIPSKAEALSQEEKSIYDLAFDPLMGFDGSIYTLLNASRMELNDTFDALNPVTIVVDNISTNPGDDVPTFTSTVTGEISGMAIGTITYVVKDADGNVVADPSTLKSTSGSYTVEPVVTGGDASYEYTLTPGIWKVKLKNTLTYTAKSTNHVYTTGSVSYSVSGKNFSIKGTLTWEKGAGNDSQLYINKITNTSLHFTQKGKPVGSYKLYFTVRDSGNDDYAPASLSSYYTVKVTKAGNTIAIAEQSLSANYSGLSDATTDALNPGVTNTKGVLTYSYISAADASGADATSCFSIGDASTGKIKYSADTPLGTYTLNMHVKDSGGNNYNAAEADFVTVLTINKT